MRLIRSNSTEVAQRLASRGCVYARDPYADIHVCIGGNVFIAVVITSVPMLVGFRATVIAIAVAAAVLLNGILLYRARLGRQHWIIASSGSMFYVRLFMRRKNSDLDDPDVIELSRDEIRSIIPSGDPHHLVAGAPAQ